MSNLLNSKPPQFFTFWYFHSINSSHDWEESVDDWLLEKNSQCLRLRTLLRMMIPSWLCSLVVMSNMAPPSPGTMVYSTSAFFPMSKSWALILPTADPTAEDSGTLKWKKPVNKQTSEPTQTGSFIIITWHPIANTELLHILCPSCSPASAQGCLIHPQAGSWYASVWSQSCSYEHDIIQFWHVWTSRLLGIL